MKTPAQIALLIMLLSGVTTFAQKDLYGEWYVSCVFGIHDKTGETVCTLCPVIKNNTGFSIPDFSMKIKIDEIDISVDGKVETVKYKWNDKEGLMEFSYNQTPYAFQVLHGGSPPPASGGIERYIWKDKNGTLLLLDPK